MADEVPSENSDARTGPGDDLSIESDPHLIRSQVMDNRIDGSFPPDDHEITSEEETHEPDSQKGFCQLFHEIFARFDVAERIDRSEPLPPKQHLEELFRVRANVSDV